jgi:hypothetical protein
MVLAAVAAVVDTAAVAVAAATVVAAAVAATAVVAVDAATVAEAVVVEAAVDVALIAITKPISRSLNRIKQKSGGKCLRFFCFPNAIT